MQDRHHELPVVLHYRTLTRGEDMGFSPSQADADAEVSRLGARVGCAWILGHVQSGDAEGAARTANLHQGIQHRRRDFFLRVVTVTTSLKAHAIYRAVHFWNLEDVVNLIADRGIF